MRPRLDKENVGYGEAPKVTLRIDPVELADIDAEAKRLGVGRSTVVRARLAAGRKRLKVSA